MRRKCEVQHVAAHPATKGRSRVGMIGPRARAEGQLPTKASTRACRAIRSARRPADKIDLWFCSHYRCGKAHANWEDRMQKLMTGLGGLAAAVLTLSAAN